MYHSFLVRIWREADQEPGDMQITAESVQSGQTHCFDSLTSLLDFLQDHIDLDEPVKTRIEQHEFDETDLDLS